MKLFEPKVWKKVEQLVSNYGRTYFIIPGFLGLFSVIRETDIGCHECWGTTPKWARNSLEAGEATCGPMEWSVRRVIWLWNSDRD